MNSSSKIVKQRVKLPVLEKVLLKYVSALREGGMPVSKSSIQAQALIISQRLQEKGHPDLQVTDSSDGHIWTVLSELLWD